MKTVKTNIKNQEKKNKQILTWVKWCRQIEKQVFKINSRQTNTTGQQFDMYGKTE